MRYIVALLLFVVPGVAIGAGFATESLFLSKASVTEGDTVFIHAVVNNDAATSFAADMVFKLSNINIGTVPVSLKAGEAGTVSVSWKPGPGTHQVTAELVKGGEVLEYQSATFTVAAKPKPAATSSTPTSTTTIESSKNIQASIESLSPAVAGATAPVFKLIDGGRESLAKVIDSQMAAAKKNLGSKEGETLGDQTGKAASDPMGTFWFVLWTLYLYLLTLLGFVISSAGVFYPVIAILILYSLWRLIRRMRRPAY
jgi:hypothetical protein